MQTATALSPTSASRSRRCRRRTWKSCGVLLTLMLAATSSHFVRSPIPAWNGTGLSPKAGSSASTEGSTSSYASRRRTSRLLRPIVIEPDRFIETGESVVVPNVSHQRGRDGIEVTARSTFVFTLRDRKVTRVRLYQETGDALKSVGLEE